MLVLLNLALQDSPCLRRCRQQHLKQHLKQQNLQQLPTAGVLLGAAAAAC
jgi:hypothetical protein